MLRVWLRLDVPVNTEVQEKGKQILIYFPPCFKDAPVTHHSKIMLDKQKREKWA